MRQFDALTQEAAALGAGCYLPSQQAEIEVDRILTICNACRYCEGFCAVFQGMTRRLDFNTSDIHYLANLCHNCGACLHACQYAPPHEFAVNVPRAMAQVRVKTYGDYAWPAALGGLYRSNGLLLAMCVSLALAVFLMLAVSGQGSLFTVPERGFYGIFPHGLMVSLFAPVFLFSGLALMIGLGKFWSKVAPPSSGDMILKASDASAARLEASRSTMTLKYLDGGHGEGCNNDDDKFTLSRKRFHHYTFYGFLLCFASTSSATILHYVFDIQAPYGYVSLPKLLGIPGGIAMVVGTVGLWQLNRRRHVLHGDPAQKTMDLGFIALLFAIATTGLALMLAKGTSLMPSLLCVHLAVVMALFLTMPYSKFAHGFYRSAALLKFAIEKRQPSKLQSAGE
jgi:citrate/tricarballylate utilization protein